MSNKFDKFYRFSPYIIIIFGILISIILSMTAYNYYKEKEQIYYDLKIKEINMLIKNHMASYEQLMRSASALFDVSENISRDDWQTFTKKQKLNEKFNEIQGLGYSEVVLPEDKQQYEEKIRKEGFSNYSIKPQGQRDMYTPVTYIEPFTQRNQRALGYDVFSEEIRKEAILKAVETGKATLTRKITLVQEYDENIQSGFLMYFPIYKKGFILNNIDKRISAIKGLVSIPFRANNFIDDIIGTISTDINLTIYDENNISEENLLYNSNINNKFEKIYKKTPLTINKHTWTLVFKIDKLLKDEYIYIIFLIPVICMLIAILLSLLIISLISTKEKAVQIASKAIEKLHDSEERLRFALEGSGDGLWDWNIETNEVYFSKRLKEMLGFEDHEWGNTFSDWKNKVHPKDFENVYKTLINHKDGKSEIYKSEYRLRCKDGTYKWILGRGIVVKKDISGLAMRMVGSHSDISVRKKDQLKIEEYINIVENNVISSNMNLEGNITKVSKAFCFISGYTKNELLGKSYDILKDKDTPTEIYTNLWKTITSGNIWKGEFKNVKKDASFFWLEATISPIKNEQNIIIGYTAIHQDITDKKYIEEISITDKLTKLYNRLKLDEMFTQILTNTKRYNTLFSIIMIDIDHFKRINDLWGHQAGDEILIEFASLIQKNIRLTDIAGRWGGEEFLILLPNTNLQSAIQLSEKLREQISIYKFPFTGHTTGSFGVSSYHIGDDEKTMLKRADDALYSAKENGRDKVESEVI